MSAPMIVGPAPAKVGHRQTPPLTQNPRSAGVLRLWFHTRDPGVVLRDGAVAIAKPCRLDCPPISYSHTIDVSHPRNDL